MAVKAIGTNQRDQQSDWEHEVLKPKGDKEKITMLMSMKIKDGDSEVECVNKVCRLTNEVMN